MTTVGSLFLNLIIWAGHVRKRAKRAGKGRERSLGVIRRPLEILKDSDKRRAWDIGERIADPVYTAMGLW